MEPRLANKPGCFICGLAITNKKERRKLSNLYNKSVIWLHNGCMNTYNETYFHGVPMIELYDKKCEICRMPFDTKTFVINKHRKISHKMCIGNECVLCREMIGLEPYSIYIDYNPTNSRNANPGKSVTVSNNYGKIKTNSRAGIGSKAKYKIHNKCIYRYRAAFVSKSWVDLDYFWPNICNRSTFTYFPREFRSMAITFMRVISRLQLKTTINTDTLFIILNYCNRPAYYKYQNGFDVGLQCRMCDRPLPITKIDLEVHMCTDTKCKYIKYRCQCGIDVPHDADPKISCTNYRCYHIKCVCGGDIRYDFDQQPELCTFQNCDILYHVPCTCGKKLYKIPTNIKSNTTKSKLCVLSDKTCTVIRCASRIFERNCTCGAPLYNNDPLINGDLCVIGKCKVASRYGASIDSRQATPVRKSNPYRK